MINFNDIHIFWINNPSNIRRNENIKKIIKKYFSNNISERVDAVMENPKYQGVSMAHTIALMKGIKCRKPFIILEDDIITNEDTIDIKALESSLNSLERSPDAVYLGLSNWGKKGKDSYLNGENNCLELDNRIYLKNGAIVKKHNDYFVRIYDMFSAHSILYISKEYVIKTLKYIIIAIELSKPHDILLPNILKKYFVLGLKKPWFYQSHLLGGQEKDTNIKIDV